MLACAGNVPILNDRAGKMGLNEIRDLGACVRGVLPGAARVHARLLGTIAALCIGCTGQVYTCQARTGAEQRLQPTRAQVVVHEEAGRHGRPTALSIPFTRGRDGTELVSEFLAIADARRAAHVADLAIYLQTRQDDQIVECRSEIVPEVATTSTWRAPVDRLIAVNRPVTRLVTEFVFQCKPVTTTEMRSYMESEQQCSNVSHPVQRSRMTYSTSYNSLTHSTSSIPHTEYYTEYQSSYECRSVPVSRTRSEMVTQTRCGSEPQSRTVTRFEFQLEQQYVPGHFETLTRQRLRELDPVCYTLGVAAGPGPNGPKNRIEGLLLLGE